MKRVLLSVTWVAAALCLSAQDSCEDCSAVQELVFADFCEVQVPPTSVCELLATAEALVDARLGDCAGGLGLGTVEGCRAEILASFETLIGSAAGTIDCGNSEAPALALNLAEAEVTNAFIAGTVIQVEVGVPATIIFHVDVDSVTVDNPNPALEVSAILGSVVLTVTALTAGEYRFTVTAAASTGIVTAEFIVQAATGCNGDCGADVSVRGADGAQRSGFCLGEIVTLAGATSACEALLLKVHQLPEACVSCGTAAGALIEWRGTLSRVGSHCLWDLPAPRRLGPTALHPFTSLLGPELGVWRLEIWCSPQAIPIPIKIWGGVKPDNGTPVGTYLREDGCSNMAQTSVSRVDDVSYIWTIINTTTHQIFPAADEAPLTGETLAFTPPTPGQYCAVLVATDAGGEVLARGCVQFAVKVDVVVFEGPDYGEIVPEYEHPNGVDVIPFQGATLNIDDFVVVAEPACMASYIQISPALPYTFSSDAPVTFTASSPCCGPPRQWTVATYSKTATIGPLEHSPGAAVDYISYSAEVSHGLPGELEISVDGSASFTIVPSGGESYPIFSGSTSGMIEVPAQTAEAAAGGGTVAATSSAGVAVVNALLKLKNVVQTKPVLSGGGVVIGLLVAAVEVAEQSLARSFPTKPVLLCPTGIDTAGQLMTLQPAECSGLAGSVTSTAKLVATGSGVFDGGIAIGPLPAAFPIARFRYTASDPEPTVYAMMSAPSPATFTVGCTDCQVVNEIEWQGSFGNLSASGTSTVKLPSDRPLAIGSDVTTVVETSFGLRIPMLSCSEWYFAQAYWDRTPPGHSLPVDSCP